MITITSQTYKRTDGSFGFKIYRDGVLFIDQPTAPGVPGFVSMTNKKATAYAKAEVDALQVAFNPPAELEAAST